MKIYPKISGIFEGDVTFLGIYFFVEILGLILGIIEIALEIFYQYVYPTAEQFMLL